jgi:hypothetical protein
MQRIRGVSGPIQGHYRAAFLSGLTTGLAAGAPVFSARWATQSTLRAAILRLRASAFTITAFTTAQELQIQAFLASSFTASDTGGTQAIPAAGQNSFLQVSESAQASQFTDLRVASTSALGAGTRTLDTTPFLAGIGFSTNPAVISADWDQDTDQKLPIILQGGGYVGHGGSTNVPANAQGIVVTNGIAQGATGTVRFLIELEWLEFNWDSAETVG